MKNGNENSSILCLYEIVNKWKQTHSYLESFDICVQILNANGDIAYKS